MTLRQAQQLPGVTSARKLDNNTFSLTFSNGNRTIRLHDTDIVVYYPDGSFQLNTGGFQTTVTKDRINKFAPVTIKQRKGLWYVTTYGKQFDFFTGMIFKDDVLLNSPEKIEQQNREEATAGLKSIAMVAMMGDIFGGSQAQSNNWKKRMLQAGCGEGLMIPDDWETLSEDEKARRLDGVINIMKN